MLHRLEKAKMGRGGFQYIWNKLDCTCLVQPKVSKDCHTITKSFYCFYYILKNLVLQIWKLFYGEVNIFIVLTQGSKLTYAVSQ